MTQRRAQAFVFWLLPILVLRALMPAGIMLDVSSGTPVVAMCSGGFFNTAGSHNGGTTSQHDAEHYSVCPFAMALGAAPPVAVTSVVDTAIVVVSDDAVATANPVPLSGPIRTHLTRGPPALS